MYLFFFGLGRNISFVDRLHGTWCMWTIGDTSRYVGSRISVARQRRERKVNTASFRSVWFCAVSRFGGHLMNKKKYSAAAEYVLVRFCYGIVYLVRGTWYTCNMIQYDSSTVISIVYFLLRYQVSHRAFSHSTPQTVNILCFERFSCYCICLLPFPGHFNSLELGSY